MELRSGAQHGKECRCEEVSSGNVLNLWVMQYGRPLLVIAGHIAQADSLLEVMDAASALVVPLFVSNRVIGSLQLFRSRRKAFNRKTRNSSGSCHWLRKTFSPANPPMKV